MYVTTIISFKETESKQKYFSPISISYDVKFNNAQVDWPVTKQGH